MYKKGGCGCYYRPRAFEDYLLPLGLPLLLTLLLLPLLLVPIRPLWPVVGSAQQRRPDFDGTVVDYRGFASSPAFRAFADRRRLPGSHQLPK